MMQTFLTHIICLNPAWNNAAGFQLNSLQRLQNKIIKTIERKPRLTPTISLYNNKLNIREYGQMQTIITIQKIKMNQIKFGYTLNFVAESRRTLRIYLINYRPAFFKTERCKRSILSYGVNLHISCI